MFIFEIVKSAVSASDEQADTTGAVSGYVAREGQAADDQFVKWLMEHQKEAGVFSTSRRCRNWWTSSAIIQPPR